MSDRVSAFLRSLTVATVLGASSTLSCAEPAADDRVLEEAASAWTDPNDPNWGCYHSEPGHPTSDERDAFIKRLADTAKEVERVHGVPAAGMLAMAIYEGGYGFTRVAIYAKNSFGFKYRPATAGGRPAYTLKCQPATDPGREYVIFESFEEGMRVVAYNLATLSADWQNYKAPTDRYRAARRAGGDVKSAVDQWLEGIVEAGYNGNDKDRKALYKREVKAIAKSEKLYDYSAGVTPGGGSATPP